MISKGFNHLLVRIYKKFNNSQLRHHKIDKISLNSLKSVFLKSLNAIKKISVILKLIKEKFH